MVGGWHLIAGCDIHDVTRDGQRVTRRNMLHLRKPDGTGYLYWPNTERHEAEARAWLGQMA